MRILLFALRTALLNYLISLGSAVDLRAADQAAQLSESAAPTSQSLSEWRKHIIANPPRGGNCFASTYPNPNWQSIDCAPFPRIPMQVGNAGNDYGPMTSSVIAYATGAFLTTPGLASECDGSNSLSTAAGSSGTGGQDDFSLQLNAWSGYQPQAIVQFVYLNKSSSNSWLPFPQYSGPLALLFIEMGVLPSSSGGCPPNFQPGSNGYCSFKSPLLAATVGKAHYVWFGNARFPPLPIPRFRINVGTPVPILDLDNLNLTGFASDSGANSTTNSCLGGGSSPSVEALLINGVSASAFCVYDPTNLYKSWKAAEFNVFGLGNSSEAYFHGGTTISVQTALATSNNNGLLPNCPKQGITDEANNLNLVGTCSPIAGPISFMWTNYAGAIQFTEANDQNVMVRCGSGN
jgi:hypothetical protein